MTRQLPGFFIFAVVAVYLVLAQESRVLKNIHLYGGIALAAAVILPWHLIMYAKYGQKFLGQYFGVALMTGIYGYPAGYSSSPSLNPWYAYFEILLSNYEPWLPFFAVGAYYAVKDSFRGVPARRDPLFFVLLWAVVPLALFQIAKVKQYHYINPLYIPFAVLTATAFRRFAPGVRMKAMRLLAAAVSAAAVLYLLFPIIPRTLDSREFDDTIGLIPAVRKLDADVSALPKGFCHYNNCFMFYGDRKVMLRSEEEMIAEIYSNGRHYFVLSRENFDRLSKRCRPSSLRILSFSRQSVLCANR
jgi:4-amino-4-deoxy-L-arabinose transferase-like glycosyltransferase